MQIPSLPRITLAGLRKFLIILLASSLLFAGGYYVGFTGYKADVTKFPKVTITREVPVDKKELNFSLFWRVWDTLAAKYFDNSKLNPSTMVYGAIKGMVSAIGDPYTVFLEPSENKVVQEDLNGIFEGVGIQIGFKGTRLTIITPLPASPAEAAGVKAGDFVIGIKDEGKNIERGTVGISLPEAVQAIRGKAGTKVTLTLLREGEVEPIVVEIVRKELNIPNLVLTYAGDGGSIAHIKILKFVGETEGEWEKAVREISRKKEVTAVILDLRNNPGGYLQSAVDTASEFLTTGTLVVSEERSDGSKTDFKVERLGLLINMPVVVLVNEGSASASEILAGALRDGRKANLVGEKTFGKGTIQEPLQLEGGSGLHITIARWITPSGYWVNEKGLEPDVTVKDDPDTSEDEQLQKAIEILQQ